MDNYMNTVEKFYCIHMMMHVLEGDSSNERKAEWVKKIRDKGYITNEEALDLYIRYED